MYWLSIVSPWVWSPPENRGTPPPFSRSPPKKLMPIPPPPPLFRLMLSRVNPTTLPLFVLFLLDDVIILPKHKYENLNYQKWENQKTKYLKPSITNPPRNKGNFGVPPFSIAPTPRIWKFHFADPEYTLQKKTSPPFKKKVKQCWSFCLLILIQWPTLLSSLNRLSIKLFGMHPSSKPLSIPLLKLPYI